MNSTCLPLTILPLVASTSLKVSTLRAKSPVIILVRADNNLASKVANGATFRSASMDCSSFHASLTHLKALSGSVDAATTASRVLILQFLYVSASGKAGILIESASLTLGLSSDLGSMFPPRNLMSFRLNF